MHALAPRPVTQTDDIAGLSYERALEELDALITRLEAGKVDLEEAIACYERGARLAQRCEELLDRTEQGVMQLVVGGRGGLEERPFTVDPGRGETESPEPGPPRARPAPTLSPRPSESTLLPGLEGTGRAGRPPIDPDEIPF